MNNSEKKKAKKALKQMQDYVRYTEDELSLISNTFTDRDDLLMILRKFFLQGELTEDEKILLKPVTLEAIDVIQKCFIPEINTNAPLYLGKDLWARIDMTSKLWEDSVLDMKSEEIVIDYLKEQFDRLRGRGEIRIKLSDLIYNERKTDKEAYCDLKARNKLLNHIDECLKELRMLSIANAKVEDSEKIKMMDSNI